MTETSALWMVDPSSRKHVRYICFEEACVTVNQTQSCTNGPARCIDCVKRVYVCVCVCIILHL